MHNRTGTPLLSITIAVIALITVAMGVHARINALDTSITITSRVHGNAPRATPIQAIINNDDHRMTYELTGIARRNGNTMTVTLYQPLPEMLRPVTDYAPEESISNPNAKIAFTYMPFVDGGRYALQNRNYPMQVPYTHLQPGDRNGGFVYVTEDVTINTQTDYPYPEGGIYHYKAGWNLVVHEYLDITTGRTRNYVAPLDALEWYWHDLEQTPTAGRQ